MTEEPKYEPESATLDELALETYRVGKEILSRIKDIRTPVNCMVLAMLGICSTSLEELANHPPLTEFQRAKMRAMAEQLSSLAASFVKTLSKEQGT